MTEREAYEKRVELVGKVISGWANHIPVATVHIMDTRTQEEKDFAEAMEEVNRIAPGWPV